MNLQGYTSSYAALAEPFLPLLFMRRSNKGHRKTKGFHMSKLNEIISAAKEELEEQFDTDLQYPEDLCTEIADQSVPIYSHELASLASDPEIFHHENELPPAFSGEPTLNNIIATAVYEIVSDAVFSHLYELQQAA